MSIFNSDEIAKRLKNYPSLSKFSLSLLKELVAQSEIIELPSDSMLFYSSDSSNYVYYMIDGCAEVFSTDTLERRITLIRSGDMIGEAGVVAGDTYGLTTKIHRPSQLLKISKDVFLKFFKENPELLMQLTQTMAKRLRNMVMGLHEKRYPFKNVILYIMSPKIDIMKIKAIFQKCALKDKTQIYDKNDFAATQVETVAFFNQCENNPGVNVFLINEIDDPWSRISFLYVEYIYLMTTEDGWNTIDPEILNSLKGRPCDISIWHPTYGRYANTKSFYECYSFKRHHHVADIDSDYQRLYRYMTGQTIGLVISGGGFRGYAHYGLIKALFETGVPIDCIGGSSMGAVLGAGLAINPYWEQFSATYEGTMKKLKRNGLFKITLPIFSVLSGELATNLLRDVYGPYQIEDLPINFFCVVSNLSKRQKEVKHIGELWEWLRGSMAIPGIFPPFEKNGSIYVDGAVCTNLPVQDMQKYLDDSGKIITLDISLPLLPQDKYSCPPILTLKEALLYKLGFSKKGYVFPSLLNILLESSSINQYIYDTEGAKKADIIIAPDTSSLSFLNPSKGSPLSLIAYEFAMKKLQEHKEVFARWL